MGRPPPTRGSVVDSVRRSGHPQAPPAHAGISRNTSSPRASPRGAPRPRGDQSMLINQSLLSCERPPPTRGSVGDVDVDPGVGEAPPAHAGISRICRISLRRGCGAPRPRGDQSSRAPALAPVEWRPPPTRGSVVVVGWGDVQHPAPPAHAGISRNSRQQLHAEFGAPPPTRGSVVDVAALVGGGAAPPAHAGISRCTFVLLPPLRGAPRPRGDQSVGSQMSVDEF